MNTKQVWGAAGGFFIAYLLITLTNKPQVSPKAHRADRAPEPVATERRVAEAPAAPSARSDFQKGFCYPGLGAVSLSDAASDAELAALAASGADWVAIMPVLTQATGSASEVTLDAATTTTDSALTHAIAVAHDQGLSVMLRPIVAARDGTRRDAFAPADPEAWFTSYTALLDHELDLAEAGHVEAVCLGSSYSRLEEGLPWAEYIRSARERYHGRLTYGASVFASDAGGYRRVPFWSELDTVGLDVVLDGIRSPSAFQAAADDVERWLTERGGGMRVVVTSFGAAGIDQDAAIRSFLQTFYARPWLSGAFAYFWHNPAIGSSGGPYALSGTSGLEAIKASFTGEN